jgi:VanZ family protein
MNIFYKRDLFKSLFRVWLIIIFISNFLPGLTHSEVQIDRFTFRLDYIIHFLIFFILGFFMQMWRITNNLDSSYLKSIYMILGGILFAFISEFPQKFLPYRTFNVVDFICNSAGIVIGFISTGLIVKKYFASKVKSE